MKKLTFFSILTLLLLLMVSCGKDSFDLISDFEQQDEVVTDRGKATVPFKGKYTTAPELLSIDENGVWVFDIPSEGNATHLGKSAWYSLSSVYMIGGPPWVQTGTSVFTAADGSTLVGAFSGTTGPEGDSPFVGAGTYWIDYGTGRFEGTTGGGTYAYRAVPDLSSAQLTFVGTLDKP